MALADTPDGYVIEVSIPFSSLNRFQLMERQEIGIELALDDADNGSARQMQMTWGGGPDLAEDVREMGVALFGSVLAAYTPTPAAAASITPTPTVPTPSPTVPVVTPTATPSPTPTSTATAAPTSTVTPTVTPEGRATPTETPEGTSLFLPLVERTWRSSVGRRR